MKENFYCLQNYFLTESQSKKKHRIKFPPNVCPISRLKNCSFFVAFSRGFWISVDAFLAVQIFKTHLKELLFGSILGVHAWDNNMATVKRSMSKKKKTFLHSSNGSEHIFMVYEFFALPFALIFHSPSSLAPLFQYVRRTWWIM